MSLKKKIRNKFKNEIKFFYSRMRSKVHPNADLGGPSLEKKSTNKPYSFQKIETNK